MRLDESFEDPFLVEEVAVGYLDRDYMRAEDRRAGPPSPASPVRWLVWALLIAAGLLLFDKHLNQSRWTRTLLGGGDRVMWRTPARAPATDNGPTPKPGLPVVQPPPGFVPPPRVSQPVLPPQPQAEANPLKSPGTIYLCKAYAGGTFWSDTHCSAHKALIDRIASVPVGLPFKQQVDIASGQARAIQAEVQATEREAGRLTQCAALQSERDAIWVRSRERGGSMSIDELGRDQSRWKYIDRQLNAYGCSRR